MAAVHWGEQSYLLNPEESVLDALARNGVLVSYACKAGSCGSCMLRAQSGTIPQRAQSGLKDSWKAQGYFLPCVCVPESDLSVGPLGAEARIGATIISLKNLSASVKQVILRSQTPLEFHAGQYITIIRGDRLARSYSIASLPSDGLIELHVRRIPNGHMSGWVHERARAGEQLTILGPSGECFYVGGSGDQPLLLAGTGTGLAPLWGILRDALSHGHSAPIHVFHGAVQQEGLYLCDELHNLATKHENVSYTPVLLKGDEADGISIGAIDQVILRQYPKLSGWRAYLAGDPGVVQLMKKKLFLAGIASRDLFADPFLYSVGPSR